MVRFPEALDGSGRRAISCIEAAVPAAMNRFCRRYVCYYNSNCSLRRERSNDCLEARIAPQRIPQRVKAQIAVSHMASWEFGRLGQSLNCAVRVARPRVNDSQVLD